MSMTLISEKVLLSDRGDELDLKYYLLEGSEYGIRIMCNGEVLNINEISKNRKHCMDYIHNMARFNVTPTTAFDVIEDWL